MENQIEGLGNKRNSNRYFLSMWVDAADNAFFTLKAEANAEGAHHRLNSKNQDRWEYRYDTITGLIEKILVRNDDNYGLQWVFEIRNVENLFVLTLGYDSGRALSILKQLPNVDVGRELELQASPDRIFIMQDGNNVKWFWSRENNPLPEWEWFTDPGTGKKKADKTGEINEIKKWYAENMTPEFIKLNPDEKKEEPKVEQAPPPQEPPPATDDELDEIFGKDEAKK